MFFLFSYIIDEESDYDTFRQIGLIDQSQLTENLDEIPSRFLSFDDEVAARLALDNDEIDAYVVIGADYMDTGTMTFYSQDIPGEGMSTILEDLMVQALAHEANTPYPIERLIDPVDIQIKTFDGEMLGDASGEYLVPRFLTPIVFVLIMVMGVFTTTQFLMSSVVEEKENRLLEVLMTSSTAETLLWGKMIGLGALALTQIVAWGLGSYGVTRFRPDTQALIDKTGITLELLALFLFLFLLEYGLISSMMIGIGAAVDAEQEGQQIAGILVTIAIAPVFLLQLIIQNPTSPLLDIMNVFPLTAALTLLLRSTFTADGASATWIIITGVVMVVSTIFFMRLSARIFRLGMLNYGKRTSLRDIMRAVIS